MQPSNGPVENLHHIVAQSLPPPSWLDVLQPYGITGLIIVGAVLLGRMAFKHGVIPDTIDALTRRRQQKHAETVDAHVLGIQRHGNYLIGGTTQKQSGGQELLVLPAATSQLEPSRRLAIFELLDDHEDRLQALENQSIVITAQLEPEGDGGLGLKLRNKSPTETARSLDVRVVAPGATIKVTGEDGVDLAPGEGHYLLWPLEDDGETRSYDIAVTWREGDNLATRRMTVWVPGRS